MGRRVVIGRLRDTRRNGVAAVGIVQWEDADVSKDYEAKIKISKNGTQLGEKTISLPAGSDRVTDPAPTDTTGEIEIWKQSNPRGEIEIIARYRFQGLAATPTDRFEYRLSITEVGTGVVASGTAQATFV